MRIVGGVTHIVSEEQSNPSVTLITIFSILEGAGLSPLMMATLGFLSTVYVPSNLRFHLCCLLTGVLSSLRSEGIRSENVPQLGRGLKLLGILSTVALILTIVGGVNLANAKTPDDVNSGTKFRHIGVILFLVLYILLALLHVFFWTRAHSLMLHRRTVRHTSDSYSIIPLSQFFLQLLTGISAVLPFLFIRTLYAVLSGFSPASIPGTQAPENALSKFNSSSGSWQIFLVMSVIMELLVVFTYLVVGIKVPLQKDFNEADTVGSSDHELYPKPSGPPPQYPPNFYRH